METIALDAHGTVISITDCVYPVATMNPMYTVLDIRGGYDLTESEILVKEWHKPSEPPMWRKATEFRCF